MADVKLMVITPGGGSSLSTLTLNFGDDGVVGMSFDSEYIAPMSPQRLQDLTLVTQNVPGTKENITLTATLQVITFHTYLRTLRIEGIEAVLQVVYEDSSYTEQDEFNGTVKLVDYSKNKDAIGNVRSVTGVFMEV